MKYSLSILLSASVLFQTIVFSSGLFGCILVEKAKICECNHGSKLQKHSNEEDKNFSKKVHSEIGQSFPRNFRIVIPQNREKSTLVPAKRRKINFPN